MKTPKEMALEYAHTAQIFWDGEPIEHHIVVCKEMAFLAGYQAAKDQLQPQPFHAGADVYIIDANNPMPKPMPLSIAEQVQFADADKVMNSSNNSNGWLTHEELEASGFWHTNNLSTSAKWISVNERLPEVGTWCLWMYPTGPEVNQYEGKLDDGTMLFHRSWYDSDDEVTHWMLFPELPKENK